VETHGLGYDALVAYARGFGVDDALVAYARGFGVDADLEGRVRRPRRPVDGD
jgi:hypothetical protein